MNTALAEYYARRALEYEAIYQKPERQPDLAVLRQRIPALLAGTDVLEVACGTGYWTAYIAPRVRSVRATDFNEAVLAVARAKGWPDHVAFQQADAFSLEAIAGRFTAGFGGFWWSHVEKSRLSAFLDQFHAVLGAGARVVFVDNRYVEGSSTPMARQDAEGNTYQHRRLQDGSAHEVLKNFPEREEVFAVLEHRATEVIYEALDYYWLVGYRVNR